MSPEPEPITASAPALSRATTASQRWSDLFFIHWRVDSALVAPLLPRGLVPDVHDGSSWVGLIPFVLDKARFFNSPPVPYFGRFVEVNVRLYAVDARGRRGVVFVSLEASRLAAVIAARVAFSLPYEWSSTTLVRRNGEFSYAARRHMGAPYSSSIVARPSTRAVIGDSRADFLTARWALFTSHRGHTLYLPNEHEPWALYEATLVSIEDDLLEAAGFPGVALRAPDSVLYSPGVDTRFGRGEVLQG